MVVLLAILCHLVLNLLGLEHMLSVLSTFILRAVCTPNLICIFIIKLTMLTILVTLDRIVVAWRHLRRQRACLIYRGASKKLLASHHIVILMLLSMAEYRLRLVLFQHLFRHIILLVFLVLFDRVCIILVYPNTTIFVRLVLWHLICEVIILMVLHIWGKLETFLCFCVL